MSWTGATAAGLAAGLPNDIAEEEEVLDELDHLTEVGFIVAT